MHTNTNTPAVVLPQSINDLIFLMQYPGEEFPSLIILTTDAAPEYLHSIDFEKMSWRPVDHEDCPYCNGEAEIGRSLLRCSANHKSRRGPLFGVYNTLNLSDMFAMLFDARDLHADTTGAWVEYPLTSEWLMKLTKRFRGSSESILAALPEK